MNRDKSIFIFLRGLPGSGKTSLANMLSQKEGFVVVSPDLISPLEIKNENGIRIKNLKYRHLLDKALVLIKAKHNIVWEQPWRKTKNIPLTIENIRSATLKDTDNIKFYVVEIKVNPTLSWKRSKKKFESEDYFKSYISKYKEVDLPNDLFEYIELGGDKPIDEIYKELVSKLRYNSYYGSNR